MIYRTGQYTLNLPSLPLSEYLKNRKYAHERLSAAISLRGNQSIDFPKDYLEAFSSRFVMEYLGSPYWKTLFDWVLENALEGSGNRHGEAET